MSKPSLAGSPAGVWPSKAEAAARLGVSARTVERYIDSGRLGSRQQHAPGRKPVVVVDPAGLNALLAESAAVPASLVRSAPAAASPAASAAPLAALAELLASRLAPPAPAAPLKPWLTLDEAAEYSGLPAPWLLAQARSGSLVAVNVGMGSQERWRFSRRRLALLVPSS